MEPSVKVVNIQKLAEIMEVSVSAIRWHVRTGSIPCLRLGRRIFFRLDDVWKAMSSHEKNCIQDSHLHRRTK